MFERIDGVYCVVGVMRHVPGVWLCGPAQQARFPEI